MAMRALIVLCAVLAYQPCNGRSMPEGEDSVVSVYTTLPTTAGTHPSLDVYHQIANNIAERITSPIYRFLGINKTNSEKNATRKSWEKIELLDETPEEVTKPNYLPVDNDISKDRDVEELSVEALKKADKKPEKITLYNSYLPILGKLETLDVNDTVNEVDSNRSSDDDGGLTLDDVGEDEPRENYFTYILEVLASIVQLIWGGITSWLKPKSSSED
ncbi:uncharacterized protein LOC114364234 isoform X2 [Ostrinia furnacalis]|uniref:uncharacterized protein LOC114364234 isoform X1 n=1 Tax=Ostrinia furnacalis TaxID=93504 RepID=UPI00103E8438|nr:uncharacterized protein LOC114364234 isoform X1 [Ostrinia furnacalis]XP_028176114.1 uncharacterized protein LOC114364234 isoform X2 [Ostrinia furnacalis]